MRIGVIITPERLRREKITKSLEEEGIDYDYIDLMSDNWEEYFRGNYDGYLIYPPSFPTEWRNIFFKRLYLVKDVIKHISTPSLESIYMYESKINMHDFYKVNEIPHIPAHTFFNFIEAKKFAEYCTLPVVVKEDTGSGAVGVKIIKDRRSLKYLVKKSFWVNANKINGATFKNVKKNLYPYKIFKESQCQYLPIENKRKGFIHIQSYVDILYEWRIIRIGESYFGHKKLEDKNGLHSGSLNKGWGPIPEELLNMVRQLSSRLKFDNMCFDIFEDRNGKYYVNELQVVFGTSTEEQLVVNGETGRYVYKEPNWIFEAGDFTKNGCNNLKVRHLKEIIYKKKDEENESR